MNEYHLAKIICDEIDEDHNKAFGHGYQFGIIRLVKILQENKLKILQENKLKENKIFPNNIKRENILAQIESSKAYMVYWQTMILSGAYKNRDITCCDKQLSDTEKLENAIAILKQHADNIREFTEGYMRVE